MSLLSSFEVLLGAIRKSISWDKIFINKRFVSWPEFEPNGKTPQSISKRTTPSAHLIKYYQSCFLTDTGENVQKWTRVFFIRRWVILVARTPWKKREENNVSTFGRFRLWTSFESSPVSVKCTFRKWKITNILLVIWLSKKLTSRPLFHIPTSKIRHL